MHNSQHRAYTDYGRVFELIRYNSDNFRENSNSNEIHVAIMSFVIMLMTDCGDCDSFELPELIDVDQSCHLLANIDTR